jgi:negative regulator of sigma E activity
MTIERDGRGRDPREADPTGDGLTPHDAALMHRAKAAFDAEAAALDATTRGRLAAARRAALAELEVPARRATPAWLPVGAAATVAIAAVGVALSLRAPPPAAPGAAADRSVIAATMPGSIVALAAEPVSEVELLLGEDELTLYAEDPEFVSWAVAETGADDAG